MLAAVGRCDAARFAATDGHFAVTARDGQTVRLARTIGMPLRYFVAKMYHGPFLVVADRMDQIFDVVPANSASAGSSIRRTPAWFRRTTSSSSIRSAVRIRRRAITASSSRRSGTGRRIRVRPGARYVARGVRRRCSGGWRRCRPTSRSPSRSPAASTARRCCSGAARRGARRKPGSHSRVHARPGRRRATRRRPNGVVRALGLERQWERVDVSPARLRPRGRDSPHRGLPPARRRVRGRGAVPAARHPRALSAPAYLLDGDGGDENLKSYPLEDSDLTLSSILRNPLLYQEGWGVDAIKHSLVYSGGLSRGYVRTYAPAAALGFDAFSPVHGALGDRRGRGDSVRAGARRRRGAARAR